MQKVFHRFDDDKIRDFSLYIILPFYLLNQSEIINKYYFVEICVQHFWFDGPHKRALPPPPFFFSIFLFPHDKWQGEINHKSKSYIADDVHYKQMLLMRVDDLHAGRLSQNANEDERYMHIPYTGNCLLCVIDAENGSTTCWRTW